MSVALLTTLGALLAAGSDTSGLAALRADHEALDQKVRVLERLRENDQEAAAAAAKSAVKPFAGAGGLGFRSADSAYSLRFRGLVRNGANWDLDDENKKTLDQFQNTTVRFGFDGAVGKVVEVKVSSDWSKGSVALQDAYFDLKLPAGLRLRTGKFQVPLGLERYVSPSDLQFFDRAFPSQIAPNRDVGAQLSGAFAADRIQVALGVFNGGADGSNLNADSNDDKDVYGRLWLQPLKGLTDLVSNFGLGFGASFGHHEASVPAGFKTTSGNAFFAWKAADTLDGKGYRLAPQAQWSRGPLLAYGEWIRSVQAIKRGGTTALPSKDLSVSAWQGALSWVLTGEEASEKGVAPRHPFDPAKGEWGAFELSARVSGIAVDDAVFARNDFADTAVSARSALAYGAAANWHLIRGTRLQAGFERTQFEKGARNGAKLRDRKAENQLFVVAGTSF